MLVEYLDYQRETVLSKTSGLTQAQLGQSHPPSNLTLGGLLYHLSLVEEDWMEFRFAGLPEREPWASVDWEVDPNGSSARPHRWIQLSCRHATVKPANAAAKSCQERNPWTKCPRLPCEMVRIFPCGGCCCA